MDTVHVIIPPRTRQGKPLIFKEELPEANLRKLACGRMFLIFLEEVGALRSLSRFPLMVIDETGAGSFTDV